MRIEQQHAAASLVCYRDTVMTESYHDAVAQHYAAFRPPLHRLILERMFPNQPTFRSKLDLGYALCATLNFAHYRIA